MDRFIISTPRETHKRMKLRPPAPGLPDPRAEASLQEAEECELVNAAISGIESTRKRKRGSYAITSEEERAQIAQYAIERGPRETARHFSAKLGHPLNESTVRSIRDKYKKAMRTTSTADTLQTLPREKRGPAPMLGDELDAAV